MELDVMRAAAGAATDLLRSLAHADRLLLLCQLSQGERTVGQLEELVGLRQPSLSQQLGVLRDAGLVRTRREGRHVHYSVADPRALQVLRLLYDLYCPDGEAAEGKEE